MRIAVATTVVLFPLVGMAAPTASFTARPIQGSTCVAPCAVHFDAIGDGTTETADPDFTREFHSLLYVWDFGDPGSGTWEHTGLSKNTDIGAIAGHLYTTPGSYTVRLRVINPNGADSLATETVTVTDPDSHFATSATWCFRDAADGDFTGCPLDTDNNGTCDGADADHCITNADFDDALSNGTDTIGCNADTTGGAMARCLFRRGDTFDQSASVALFNGTTPGLIDAFGSGALPIITGSSDMLTFGDHWTVANLSPSRTGTADNGIFRVSPARDNVTAYNIEASGHSKGCFTMDTGGATEFPNLVAGIEVDCERTTDSPPCATPGGDSCSTSNFIFADYFLWLGGLDDPNDLTESEFNFRTVHARWARLSHNRFMGTNDSRNTIQMRAWDGPTPSATPTEWWIVSDNVLSQRQNLYTIRVCQDSGCNDGASGSTENQNGIIERNFIFVEDTVSPNASQGIWIGVGDITIRNNVVDLQGHPDVGTQDVFMTHVANYPGGATNDDRIHVYNNTFYRDDTTANNFIFCDDNSGGNAESYCINNLSYDPNRSGTFTAADGTWAGSTNNLDASSNPFDGTPPAQGLTSLSDFRLASPNAATINAGYDFDAGTDTNRWVYLDAERGCRPDSTEWDIGADEFNAGAACLVVPTGNLLGIQFGSGVSFQ